MKTQKLLLTFALITIILIAFAGFIQFPKAHATTQTYTFTTGSTEDGYVYGRNSAYATAHSTAYAANALGFAYVGQDYYTSTYEVDRSFLRFNTASVTGTVTSAILSLYLQDDSSSTDFTLNIRKWTDDTPITTADYNAYDSTNYDDGTWTTAGKTAGQYYNVTISNFAIINVGGYTYIALLSNRDIASTTPTNSEYVGFLTSDQSQPAKLYITTSGTNTIGTTSNVGTATFYINGTQYTTPNSTTLANGVYNFTAPQYFYSTATYNFSNWLINTTTTYTTRTIMPNITADTTFLLTYELAEWNNTTASIAGLNSTDLDSLPANPVYNLRGDNKWVLISGSYSSTFYGWYWSGSLWIPDSTLVPGLYNDTFVWTTPTIAYNLRGDGKWVLISGDFYGVFHGWYWDGGPWIVDQTLVSGLGDIGGYSSPSIAYNLTGDAKWTLITGKSTGTFNGFYWDGNAWVSNSTLVSGLGDIGGYSMPSTALNVRGDGKGILISGEYFGNYYGFYWNGSTWTSDASIVDGLETFQLFSAPAMAFNIYGDNRWVLISGREDADWKGWENKNIISITETVTKPDVPQFTPPPIVIPETPSNENLGPSITIPGPFTWENLPWPSIVFLLIILLIIASMYERKKSKLKQGRSDWNITRQHNAKRRVRYPEKKKVKTRWNKENPWD